MDWDDTLINDTPELVEADTDKIMTLRTRLGWAMEQFLISATVGLAWSDTHELEDAIMIRAGLNLHL